MSPVEALEKTSHRPAGSVALASPCSALLETIKGFHGDRAQTRLGQLPSMVSVVPERDLTETMQGPVLGLSKTAKGPAQSRTVNGPARDRTEPGSSPVQYQVPLVPGLLGESMLVLPLAIPGVFAVLTAASLVAAVGRRAEPVGSELGQAARAAAPGGPRTTGAQRKLSYGVKTFSCPAPRRDRRRRTRTYGGAGCAGLRSRRGPRSSRVDIRSQHG